MTHYNNKQVNNELKTYCYHFKGDVWRRLLLLIVLHYCKNPGWDSSLGGHGESCGSPN